jgi:predicted NAD/FAD-binding protein
MGRKKYIEAVTKRVRPENIHLNSEIVGVSTIDGGVLLEEANGARHTYDHVIMA